MRKEKQTVHKTSIGGQAIMEGVMMRGPDKACIAVRDPKGEIVIENLEVKESAKKVRKIPVVRGVINFVGSLAVGFKAINRSAEIALSEEELEPGKFDLWLEKKFGDKAMKVVTGISMVLGVLLAVGLFILLPFYAVRLVEILTGWTSGFWFHLIEGLIRILIFVLYIFLVGRMKEIRRLFAYHGAEHKTIHCYEHNLPLEIEQVKPFTTLHKRCGTNFLLIVMIISILIFSFIQVEHPLLRLGLRLLLLPLVAGLSYEVIKLAGRFDNWFTTAISAPGLLLQKLTTSEPDEGQIEVAIASLKAVLPDREGDDTW